jgi:hypothetical protein
MEGGGRRGGVMVNERQGGKGVAAGGKGACKLSGTLPQAAGKEGFSIGLELTLQAKETTDVATVYL